MTVSKHQVFTEMVTGDHGKFAENLAKAWFVADSANRDTIEHSWPWLIWKAQRVVQIREVQNAD